MAITVLNQIRGWDKEIYNVDADPSVEGLKAAQGSLAISSNGDMWNKTGPNDNDWALVSTLELPNQNTVFVNKEGDDSTGEVNNQAKPFLTLTGAMNAITAASPTNRYTIFMSPGNYVEPSHVDLKANVFIAGSSREAVRISATSFRLAPDFTGIADNRSGFSQVVLLSACDFNWATVTSLAGKLYFNEVSLVSTINMYGHTNAIAQAQFNSCIFFGAMTVSGINVGVHTNNVHFGSITMNQHPNGGMATILNTAGGYIGNTITLNATTNDFSRRCALFARSFYMNALTVNGVSAYADVTNDSVPSAGPTITNGGNVIYINPSASGANTSLSNLVFPTAVNEPIIPANTNDKNLGDWGKQWFFNFGYVHASTGTDLYIQSSDSSFDPAGSNNGYSVFIDADGYGLKPDVSGGDVNISTAVPSGTGVRGLIKLNARIIDVTNKNIENLAEPIEPHHAATKQYVDDNAGGTPTGDPNTLAFFNTSGDLSYNAKAVFDEENNSLALGEPSQPGVVSCNGVAALARGFASLNSSIQANAEGASAAGIALEAGEILASEAGSTAHGRVYGGRLTASGLAATALGSAFTNDPNGQAIIVASGEGSIAYGSVFNDGLSGSAALINASGPGSFASGYLFGSGGQIIASGFGAHAYGYIDSGSGYVLTASGNGAFCFGSPRHATNYEASGRSSFLGGTTIQGSGGSAASGVASFNMGANNSVSGDFATSFGVLNQEQGSYCGFTIGRAATPGGTPNTWINTEYLFKAGNGTALGSENDAYVLYKDGLIKETGALIVPIRKVSDNASLNARTDRKIVLDDDAANSYVLELPSGPDGLTFQIGQVQYGPLINSQWTLNSNTDAISQEVVDAMLAMANSDGPGRFLSITLLAGTWYLV